MLAVSCSTVSSSGGCGFRFQSKSSSTFPNFIRIGKPSQSDRFSVHRLALAHGNRKGTGTSVRMALVDERQSTDKNVADPPRIMAYDLVQGALVNVYPRANLLSISLLESKKFAEPI